ncbi:hypothetical protein PP590_gp75 [Pseudoalteromonas phage HS1]|nr:hypothetical protein PP590_gp03 [Pseudoalteromonas phage HS1]YP_010660232.1 hypothetical protein PP590_gp75 [Pseudoalteromonas phage HS1]
MLTLSFSKLNVSAVRLSKLKARQHQAR